MKSCPILSKIAPKLALLFKTNQTVYYLDNDLKKERKDITSSHDMNVKRDANLSSLKKVGKENYLKKGSKSSTKRIMDHLPFIFASLKKKHLPISSFVLTQLRHNGLNLSCGMHSCYLFNNLPIFLKSKVGMDIMPKASRCFWIFIHIHFQDF